MRFTPAESAALVLAAYAAFCSALAFGASGSAPILAAGVVLPLSTAWVLLILEGSAH